MSRINDALIKAAETYDSEHPDDQGRISEQMEYNQHSQIDLDYVFERNGKTVTKPKEIK